jgi:four helix bundle protein
MVNGHRGLKVYQLAFRIAMEIYVASKSFPKEEMFSLTDQLRRATRSVAANIAEGYRKRQYPKMFVSKLADADAELSEAFVFLNFAEACGYLAPQQVATWTDGYEEVGRMLGGMMADPGKFLPRTAPHKG